MKIALILPNNFWFCPYVNIYIDILKKKNISYDLISWNRDGKEKIAGYQFTEMQCKGNHLFTLISYLKYCNFVKKVVNKNGYDRLIIFGPQIGIFLYRFLEQKYKSRYLFDYRDLSIEQKSFFQKPFKRLLDNSYANIISSLGFKKYLPKEYTYYLSHNFNVQQVKESFNVQNPSFTKSETLEILTIGGIRDYDSNIEVVKALANHPNFKLRFVGKGISAPLIEKYVVDNKIKNVSFVGYYPKEKEPQYVSSSNFLNIYYPKVVTHSSALSNRFYNALIFKKPMIVTSNSIQGDYVERFKLGVSVSTCDCLAKNLFDYLQGFDYKDFCENCNELLRTFLKDYDDFNNVVTNFLSK